MASKKKKASKRPVVKSRSKMAKKRHAVEKKHSQKIVKKPASAKKHAAPRKPAISKRPEPVDVPASHKRPAAIASLVAAAQKKRMGGRVTPLRSHEKLLEALAKKSEEAKRSTAAAREAGVAPTMKLEAAPIERKGEAEVKDLRVRRQSLIEDLKQKREAMRAIPRNGQHKEKIMTLSKQLTDIKQELWRIDSELKAGGGIEPPKK